MTRRTADLAEGGGKPHAVQDAGANLWRPRLNTAPMELGTARQVSPHRQRIGGHCSALGAPAGWNTKTWWGSCRAAWDVRSSSPIPFFIAADHDPVIMTHARETVGFPRG